MIFEHDSIYARPFEKEVRVSTGFIREFKSAEEFAVLVAHEWSHELLGSVNKSDEPRVPTRAFFEDLRVKEAEADFFISLVTGSNKVAIELLERTVGNLQKPTGMSDWEFKQFQMVTNFRLQAMRNMPEKIQPIVKADPLPKSLPMRNATNEVWQDYTRSVLYAMYPNYARVVKDLFVNIIDGDVIAEGGVVSGSAFVSLNLDHITFLVKTPEEFAVLVGHEFGHAVTIREYELDYVGISVIFAFDEIGIRRQFEADLIGILPLENGACVWANTLERLSVYTEKNLKRGDYDGKADRVRVARLRQMCKAK